MEKFPKIVQYRNIIKSLKLKKTFVGLDENEKPIYDSSRKLGKVKFRGKEKLHGSNGAIILDFVNDTWSAQSRGRVLSEEFDNAGFYKFVEERIDEIKNSCSKLRVFYDKLVIYGEWAGGSIQKGVALNQLDKMFVVFGLKVFVDGKSNWANPDLISEIPELNIYNINRGGEFDIEVNLDNPELAIEEMTKMTLQVEEESPFCKSLGVSGIGEGVVFSIGYDFEQSFKSKGEKHSKSKVKKLPTVDVEKLKNIDQFVNKHCNEDRMEQGFNIICDTEEKKDMGGLGDFIRWMNNDIWEEESDEAEENGFERKDMGKRMSPICVRWFKDKINEF